MVRHFCCAGQVSMVPARYIAPVCLIAPSSAASRGVEKPELGEAELEVVADGEAPIWGVGVIDGDARAPRLPADAPQPASANTIAATATLSIRLTNAPGNRKVIRSGLHGSCAVPSIASGAEEKPGDVEEDRCGKGKRVHPVEDAAVPGDHVPKVLDALVALHRRHHESSPKTGQGDDERLKARLPEGKRRRPPEEGAQDGGGGNTTDKALEGFAWADVRGDLPATEELAKNVLEHVAPLHHDDQKQQEGRAGRAVAADAEAEQGRRIAQAIDTDHQR